MKRTCIITFLLLILLISSKPSASVKQTVDSLFVIASSGEVKYRDMVQPAIDEIAALGQPAVPFLIDKFVTKSARERLTIVNILKKIGSQAVPDLLSALNNPNGLIVQRAAGTLGDIKDSLAVLPLIDVSDHPRWQVREQAFGSLGDIKDSRGQTVVTIGYTDEIGQVRKAAAVASGKIQINENIPLLIHMLGDPFYGARMSAAEALLQLDTQYVIVTLIDSVYSDNRQVGSLCCFLLGELKTDEALQALYEASSAMDIYLRTHAAVALVTADPDDLCGFQKSLLVNEPDRLAKLKIQSALRDARNDQKESEQ